MATPSILMLQSRMLSSYSRTTDDRRLRILRLVFASILVLVWADDSVEKAFSGPRTSSSCLSAISSRWQINSRICSFQFVNPFRRAVVSSHNEMVSSVEGGIASPGDVKSEMVVSRLRICFSTKSFTCRFRSSSTNMPGSKSGCLMASLANLSLLITSSWIRVVHPNSIPNVDPDFTQCVTESARSPSHILDDRQW